MPALDKKTQRLRERYRRRLRVAYYTQDTLASGKAWLEEQRLAEMALDHLEATGCDRDHEIRIAKKNVDDWHRMAVCHE